MKFFKCCEILDENFLSFAMASGGKYSTFQPGSAFFIFLRIQ